MQPQPAEPRSVAEQLFDLQDHQCRWPIGDPHRKGFKFCGKRGAQYPERPYCAAHAEVAYSPKGSR
jgi:GcrA cell cycle regulator